MRRPCSITLRVRSSTIVPKRVNTSSSRNWAYSSRRLSDSALRTGACVLPPTRDTLFPTSTAGFLVLVKEARVEIDLAVGDRNQIGRNIGADIAGLGLGDRQRGERTSAVLGRKLR